MITYNFKDIVNKDYTIYNIQGKITRDLVVINTATTIIASLIIQDSFETEIEIIAFNESVEHIMKHSLKINSIYFFQRLKVMANKKFQKTNHKCKLLFEYHQAKLRKINCLEYKKNNKIFVQISDKNKKKKEDKENQKSKQLSIKTFFK